jgi:hypothetical protein
MCECINKTIERVKEGLPSKNKEWENRKITEAYFEDSALIFTKQGTQTQLTAGMKISFSEPNRKGEIKEKSKIVNFTYEYCPFCGEKYEE